MMSFQHSSRLKNIRFVSHHGKPRTAHLAPALLPTLALLPAVAIVVAFLPAVVVITLLPAVVAISVIKATVLVHAAIIADSVAWPVVWAVRVALLKT